MTDLKIKSITDKGTFDAVMSESNAELQAIAQALRALLADVMPDITEVPWARQKTIGYGVGPKKMSEHFCYLAPHKAYVNLGFMYGADLDDPDSLLEGNGQLMRHIKIRSVEEVDNPAIRKLIEAASTHLPKLK